jgi:hypothetical protein
MEIIGILKQLSSASGDKTEKSNRMVAEKCIKQPGLLGYIASGFENKDKKVQSDCIEVFTFVSEIDSLLIVPFAEKIIPLLASKESKSRWEAVHTFSYIADKVPQLIFSILSDFQELIEKDKSTIVRDYAIQTIANYAKTGKEAAEKAFKILKSALDLWEEKHAKLVFIGFGYILDNLPSCKSEVARLAEPYVFAQKKVAAKEASTLLKRIN